MIADPLSLLPKPVVLAGMIYGGITYFGSAPIVAERLTRDAETACVAGVMAEAREIESLTPELPPVPNIASIDLPPLQDPTRTMALSILEEADIPFFGELMKKNLELQAAAQAARRQAEIAAEAEAAAMARAAAEAAHNARRQALLSTLPADPNSHCSCLRRTAIVETATSWALHVGSYRLWTDPNVEDIAGVMAGLKAKGICDE